MERRTHLFWVLSILLLPVLHGGCSEGMGLEALHSGDSDSSKPQVVVLWSTTNHLYEEPTRAFAAQMRGDIQVWKAQLAGSDRHALTRAIKQRDADLLVTLGTRAALYARKAFPRTPVLFTMVVDHRRHPELQSADVMGVALEVPAYNEFIQFKIVMPEMSRVLAFYSDQTSPALLSTIRTALEELEVELVAHHVSEAAEIPRAFSALVSDVDAVWLINDAALMTQPTFEFLRDGTLRAQKPFISSLSRRFAEGGALMSVSVNFGSLGFQAAGMARSHLLEDVDASKLSVQPPIGTEFVVNLATAKQIGLDIPPEAFYVADDILNFEDGEPDVFDPDAFGGGAFGDGPGESKAAAKLQRVPPAEHQVQGAR